MWYKYKFNLRDPMVFEPYKVKEIVFEILHIKE